MKKKPIESGRKSLVERSKNLSLYREEVVVNAKDGNYPAIQATFNALTDAEKDALFKLIEDMGQPREQLISVFESMVRHAVIILIFNKDKTKAIATGQIDLVKQFGTQEIGISRLGAVSIAYAFVDPEYRGRHLGKELLRLRFNVLRSNHFYNYVLQTPVKDLNLSGQKIDGKPVTKRMLLDATQLYNMLVYCDLRDPEAHFGRCVEAAEAAGMNLTSKAEKILKPYSQMTVKQYDDYLFLYLFVGTPTDNYVKGRPRKSRRNHQQSIYIFGDKELRAQMLQRVSGQLVVAGAQFNESASYYFGCEPELLSEIVAGLTQSSEYDTYLDQPDDVRTKAIFNEKFAGSDKLHLVSFKASDTYRFAAGFPTTSSRK